jgi:hypothetical protein
MAYVPGDHKAREDAQNRTPAASLPVRAFNA